MTDKTKSLLFFACFVASCLSYYTMEKEDEIKIATIKDKKEKDVKNNNQNITDTYFENR